MNPRPAARALAFAAAASVAAASLPTDAQTVRVKRIGYLSAGPPPTGGYTPLQPFLRALGDMGYAPGRKPARCDQKGFSRSSRALASGAMLRSKSCSRVTFFSTNVKCGPFQKSCISMMDSTIGIPSSLV